MSASNYPVYPVQPSFSSAKGGRRAMTLREYDNGDYRLYRRGGGAPGSYQQPLTIHHDELSTAEMQSILDFFKAVTNPGDPNGGRFLIGDFSVADAQPDPSQQLASGALLAIFKDEEIDFQIDGPCTWSTVQDINIKVVG